MPGVLRLELSAFGRCSNALANSNAFSFRAEVKSFGEYTLPHLPSLTRRESTADNCRQLTALKMWNCPLTPQNPTPSLLLQNPFTLFFVPPTPLSRFLTFRPSTLLYFPPSLALIVFSCSFILFLAPFLSQPVISPHCSHLSIYAYFCRVLRSPLTLSPLLLSPLPSCFFPLCFSLFLYLTAPLPLSFSSWQIIILLLLSAVMLLPFSASWIPPTPFSLPLSPPAPSFHSLSAVPVAGWGAPAWRLTAAAVDTLLGCDGRNVRMCMCVEAEAEGDCLSSELTTFDSQQKRGGVGWQGCWR